MKNDTRTGQLATATDLVDKPKLIAAYYEERPDPDVSEQRVIFGTSGHRGSSFAHTFNEWHILAITRAICAYRRQHKIDGPLFAGEESAGSSFARMDSSVWTTDKDGIITALLAAEITAKCKKAPGQLYAELAAELGNPLYLRSEAPASGEQKLALEHATAKSIRVGDLAGERPVTIFTNAPGDGGPIGSVKVVSGSGWFAARPSGTKAIYKIYAGSFKGEHHLAKIEAQAQTIVNEAFALGKSAYAPPQLQETA
jgi:phosphoglucomutase